MAKAATKTTTTDDLGTILDRVKVTCVCMDGARMTVYRKVTNVEGKAPNRKGRCHWQGVDHVAVENAALKGFELNAPGIVSPRVLLGYDEPGAKAAKAIESGKATMRTRRASPGTKAAPDKAATAKASKAPARKAAAKTSKKTARRKAPAAKKTSAKKTPAKKAGATKEND